MSGLTRSNIKLALDSTQYQLLDRLTFIRGFTLEPTVKAIRNVDSGPHKT